MCLLPPLFLLIFYSLKGRRLVWLTIPTSFLAYLFCCGKLLADLEFLGMSLIGLIPYMAILIAATALAAFAKKRQRRQPRLRTPAIIAMAVVAAVLVLASHNLFLDTIDGYRRIFDRPAFTRLTQIQPEDVVDVEVEVFGYWARLNGAYTDYHGDGTFFADLEFTGSMLARPDLRGDEENCIVRFTLQNGDTAGFVQYAGDEFEVFFVEDYIHQIFYVKSPQLLEDIT